MKPRIETPRLVPDSVTLLRPAHGGCSVEGCGAEVVGAVSYRAETRAVCQTHGELMTTTMGWVWVVPRG